MLKNKFCLYVIISILFFSMTVCNLLIESPSYNTQNSYILSFLIIVVLRMTYPRSKRVALLHTHTHTHTHTRTLLAKCSCVLIDKNFVYYKILFIGKHTATRISYADLSHFYITKLSLVNVSLYTPRRHAWE